MIMNTRYTLVALLATPALAQNWATYPQVPKTASINGFADPIFAKLPECAQDCVRESTGNTPCPYWDTGCLCIMPQWIDPVADCFAQNCKGSPVESAVSLANSLCTSVGAWWSVGGKESTLLQSAIGDAAAATASATSTQASEEAKSTTGAGAAPASTASPATKAEGTESRSATNAAAPVTTAPASSHSASPTNAAASSQASSRPQAAASSSRTKPPSASNEGSMKTVAIMGAAVAIVAQLL